VTITLRVRPVPSRLRRPGRGPVAALAAVLVGAAATLAACSTQSPAQTTVAYQPADGIDVNLGALEARGLVLVSTAKGAAGVLVGSLINTGNDPLTVLFLTAEQVQGGTSTTGGPSMELKPSSQTPVSGVQIGSVPAAPGALTTIVLQTKAGQVFANVPVLLPDGYYSSATATTAPTTATTSATAGADAATVTTTVTATTTATTATGG
jgi:hypothetical protein